MDFFQLSTTGNLRDQDLCLIEGPPQGLELKAYCMMRGVPAAPFWPKKPKIFLREENPGIKLTSLLGNTDSFVVVVSALKDVIASHCEGVEIEYLPFVLYDHRKRVHSKDYFIVNPIGARDCLNEQASGIKYGPQDSILSIQRFVLDPAKIGNLPALFRVDKDPTEYIVRGDLAKAIEDGKLTNVILKKLDVSG